MNKSSSPVSYSHNNKHHENINRFNNEAMCQFRFSCRFSQYFD